MSSIVKAASLCLLLGSSPALAEEGPEDEAPRPRHGIAMHGEPKYPADFTHFDYVNPDAPKRGAVRLAARGTYDSFNPFVVRGVAASGASYLNETLMVSSADEPFSMYGLVAESISVPDDRSWVEFTLREEARWHDGEPISVEDVIFSLNLLREEGHPIYRQYYADVTAAEKTGPRKVRFTFSEGENLELPLIIGQLPILPKHYWEERDFTRSDLEPPLGSGPYRVADFEPGRHVTYERVEDYWGKDLPVNTGRYNFDRIRYDYYRDETVIRQAVKAGEVDFRQENQAKAWALDYDTPAVEQGRLVMEEIPHERPTGMQGFVMNTRRPVFSDPKVRRAMAYAFDFEWSNRNLFFGLYDRTESYFSNSELASSGLPEGRELELLEPYREELPEEVFEEAYFAPSTDGSGWPRQNLKKAFELLEEAGWVVRDMKLVHEDTGEQMTFQIMIYDTAFERVVLPYVRNLRRLGIEPTVRLVDTSQFVNRLRDFNFDMTISSWGQSDSPGNEQRNYWSSSAAEMPGSRNLAGIQDPVVDELINEVIRAGSREELVAATRALDRVLLWGHYVVPHWHSRVDRLVYWNKFGHPEDPPLHGFEFDNWWIDEDRARRLREGDEMVDSPTDEQEG
ncbi:extracellular solute-binding protein [Fodinicurvata fenggangensis]|uniref:extracellular solute-binding protein n=1 Tax=Fodinicurvata fenggangensis TaxID=1121830 RepID=UPI0009DE9201|nr:extracellular solute-binding protein [Fodinicurvata fenggangensis]